MSADFLTLHAQLARSAIDSLMGGFLGHCRAAWQAWLTTDAGQVDAGRPKSRICVIAELTTFEDIEFSAGVAQLLGISWLDCDLTFILPTSNAVTFFQNRARQESFHQLVRARPVAELASALLSEDDDAIVCVVPVFSLLTTKYLDALRDVFARRADSRYDTSGAGVFRLGSWRQAGYAFGERRTPNESQQSLSFSTLPLCIAEASPRLERSLLEILDHFQQAATHPEATADAEPNELSVGALTYASRGSELVLPVQSFDGDAWLQSAPEDGPPRLYARRRLQGADFSQPIAIEPPLALVGECTPDAELVLRSRSAIRRVPLSIQLRPSRIEPWMVTCYLNRGGAGNPMIRAFAQGIGCELRYAEDETGPRPGVHVVWGVLRGSDRVVAYAKQSGRYFFYVDHAYFSRGHGVSYRVTRNGYEAGRVRECPTDRIQAHDVVLEPWQRGGGNILVCPPTDYFMAAHGCADWLEKTLEALQRYTDRPIVVRRKPQPGEKTLEPLAEALSKAHALVTHSSNVAIEAVVAGVPVFVSASSAAAPMGLTDLSSIETPAYPDRDKWLAHLAYCQFSFEEIRSGAAWRMLLESESRPFADGF